MQSPGIVLPEITEATRIRLRPGDALAVRITERNITLSEAEEIRDRIRVVLKRPELPILIFPSDAEISVVNIFSFLEPKE